MIQPKRPTEQYRLLWCGLEIIVVYTPDYHATRGEQFHHCHLEVMSQQPRVPLPITETGYRSLFLPGGVVEHEGGPVRFATQWLDQAAKSKTWKATQMEQRQGRLF